MHQNFWNYLVFSFGQKKMPKDSSFEMRANDRPNRFQVKAVDRTSHRDNDGDTQDDDTFNDEEITLRNNRRSTRYSLSTIPGCAEGIMLIVLFAFYRINSIRSSFRDKDKSKNLQTTRFQVTATFIYLFSTSKSMRFTAMHFY